MQSPSRVRSSSTTPMLEKHRSRTASDSAPETSIMVEDDRHDDSAELQPMGAMATLRNAHAASQHAAGPGFDATLERKLIKTRRKLELASFRLNKVHAAGGDTRQVSRDLNLVIEELGAFISAADPAQLLDDVMRSSTRLARTAYLQKLGAFETAVKAGYGKHAWNLVAGGAGNLVSFGLGGAVSTLTSNPLLGLAVNTTLWTFAEPLVSMIRATTVTNPYLDLYMVRQGLQARAAREALEGTSHLERNYKFAWRDKDSGETEWLNAADWLARTDWLTLWGGKHMTDDMPCHIYSVIYSATNCLPEFTHPDLYANSNAGKWTRTGIRTAGGAVAGACLQECIQLLRAWQADKTGGKETVTRTTALWKEEARVVEMILEDIDARRAAPNLTKQQAHAYAMLHRSFILWHQKAVAKSTLLSSVLYEWGAMLQPKRRAIGIDPEVPAKGLYTAASFIGKGLSQLPGLATSQLGAEAVKSSVPWIRWVGYVVPPFAMIGAAGFVVRRELEVAAHTMLGAAHGIARRCCPHEAED
ncbi:MAG: hypothetical protein EOO80_01955 [Oxalobacteraceae bacterium]|nr:MAG: hypothetical protein EOO80_01955 [Oxalobacteraceae bacterium]